MPGDLLAELISSATPPLRYLIQADPGQRARTHVPVQAWLQRVERLRATTADEALRTALGRLAELFQALTSDAAAASAAEALELLSRLGASEPESAAAEPPAAGGAAPPRDVTQAARAGAEPGSPSGAVAGVRRPSDADAERRSLSGSVAGPSGPDVVEEYLQRIAAPTETVPGVGPTRAAELAKFGLRTVEDLLYHLPFRYEDRRATRRVRDVVIGEPATAIVSIERVDERALPRGRRRVLSALCRDDSGTLELVWFNQLRYFRGRLKPGSRWIVHGRVEPGYQGPLRIVHPEIEPADDEAADARAPRIVPVYEKPMAFPAAAMRRIAHAAVAATAPLVPEVFPRAVRERYGLMPLGAALRRVHEAPLDADLEALGAARSAEHRSIVFDELFFVQLGLLQRKAAVAREPGIAFAVPGRLAERMAAELPFALTGAQRRVLAEIEADQREPRPMHRLLQGDVGSGKTLVAVAAALRAIEAGYQAVIMAPTELLAEQHWSTVRRVAANLGARLWYLTGDVGSAERRAITAALAAGEPGLAVGTHALIQEEVRFARLGLAVIDEQHRFGVLQRAALGRAAGEGGAAPDVLLMTATPIPRTLALSVYGDLDLSYLDEMPPGRKPVETRVVGMGQRLRAYEAVRAELEKGRQAYVVLPLIEESEKSDLRDATSAAEELATRILPQHRIALLHGRMPAAERDVLMRAFKAGDYDVLVATTVIEVGIDVPNASVIVIEHAERFGLAQLHQLRGRVGRGEHASLCLLVADYAQSREARERLRVMTETQDGLRIAEADLAIRGPGSLLGTRQAGLPDFRVANLLRDAAVLREARAAAEELLATDPELARAESSAIARVLAARWAGRTGLARVG